MILVKKLILLDLKIFIISFLFLPAGASEKIRISDTDFGLRHKVTKALADPHYDVNTPLPISVGVIFTDPPLRYLASDDRNADLVQILLERGANPLHRKDNFYEDALLAAASTGCVKNLSLIFQHLQNKIPLLLGKYLDNITYYAMEDNCLHRAALNGKYKSVQILLNHGMNANQRNKNAATPLYRAVLGNLVNSTSSAIDFKKTVATLCRHGAGALGTTSEFDEFMEQCRLHQIFCDERKNDNSLVKLLPRELTLLVGHYMLNGNFDSDVNSETT